MLKLVIIFVLCQMAFSLPFGLFPPLSAYDDCDPRIGGQNYSADPTACNVYYRCVDGWPMFTLTCPRTTVWTPTEEECLNSEEALNEVCGHFPTIVVEPGTDEQAGGGNANGASGGLPPLPQTSGFLCHDTSGGVKYVGRRLRCNGKPDCPDGSDELDCAAPCDREKCVLPDCKCSDSIPPMLPDEA